MLVQNWGKTIGSRMYAGSGVDSITISQDLENRGITPSIYDLYFSNSKDIFQYQSIGSTSNWSYLMNIKGEAGTFAIAKTYDSISEMQSQYSMDGVALGGLVVIDSPQGVEDPDNAKLFVKGSVQYDYLTDMSGAQGIQGPKGDKGDTGNQGSIGYVFIPNVSPEGIMSWTNNGGLSNPESVNIKGVKGDKGDTGEQGIQGPAGASGVQASGVNYIKFTNGVAICWGSTTLDAQQIKQFNFPFSFIQEPAVSASWVNKINDNTKEWVVREVTTSYTTIRLISANGSAVNAFSVIAVGKWK